MAKRGPKPHPEVLTPRQWEVLELLRQGLRDQEIADRLDVSLDGAKYHVSEILSKLGVATRAEAAVWEPHERRPVATRVIAWAVGLAAAVLLLGVGLLAVRVFSTNDSEDVTSDDPQGTTVRFQVEGASMNPTFLNGDVLEVLRYTSPVANGDIVVFAGPTSPNRDFLKRAIAGPGDVVRIDEQNNRVFVNGDELDEPYIKGLTQCGTACEIRIPAATGEPIVPGGGNSPIAQPTPPVDACGSAMCYFVLGDNRQNSSDSRQGWLVPVENIVGYVVDG